MAITDPAISITFKPNIIDMQEIRMPVIVKVLCGATIGFLFGLYLTNTFFDGALNLLFYFCIAVGAVLGVWLFRR